MIELSVVLPVFNEAENLPALHEALTGVLDGLGKRYELLYVDDGSTDGSFTVLGRLADKAPHVRLIRLRRNYGQTAAISAGIAAASGRVLCVLDSDGQNDPRDIPRLLARLDEGFDVVSGWRKHRKDPWLSRRLPSAIANRLISWITGVPLHDYGCTLKVYRAAVLRRVRLYGDMHRFIPSWMATLTSLDRIAEEEVSHFPRRHGRSKYGASGLARGVRVLLDLLTMAFFVRFRASPGHFFGRIGLACGGAGLLVLAWLSWVKLGEGAAIAGRPLLLLGILLVVIGAQFVCTGIVTEMLARTWFEAAGAPAYLVRETIGGADDEGAPSHRRPRAARERP
jgi:glycosyltransferase involved in cell wall biosynthesis